MRKLAADFPDTEPPPHDVFMGGREPESPGDGSIDELVDAIAAAGMPLPLASGRASREGQALAFVVFSRALRAAGRNTRPRLAPLHHRFGSGHAERLVRAGRW